MVTIIGAGTGIDTLTHEGLNAIKAAEVIIGASRLIDTYEELFTDKMTYREYDAKRIRAFLEECAGKNIAVLVSGDTGFYSLTEALIKDNEDIRVIPGISSVNAFFAKLHMSWQDVRLLSLHGRESNIVDAVRREHKTFALTGGNVAEIAGRLIEAGFGELEAYIGSDLGSENEAVKHCKVSELALQDASKLTVLLIINPEYDASVRTGIDDDEFIRGDVPMTKSEIRASVISKLGIRPDDICVDIGAGTGSVTVEMALSAWNGRVIAIEQNENAIELIRANLNKFHIGNTEVILGEASEVLAGIEALNVAFVGGSNGRLKEILAHVYAINPEARVVVDAIALETLSAACDCFRAFGMIPEVTQINVAKNRAVGSLNLMMASNPVYLIRGKRL